jgi:4-hydroxy-3-polyprenylbenzoate decarboxylase
MAYKSLQHFIDTLEQHGELLRINELVSPDLEITEIADRYIKANGPALLFENTGTGFPLLINALGSEKRMCLALGVEKLDDIAHDIEALFKTLSSPKQTLADKVMMLPKLGKIASWMPKTISGKGSCQQVIMDDPDITKLPVMTCWPADGGPFITLPVINTLDPENGIRNVGMYRMQVFGPKLTGMHWHKHKVSAGHFRKYKEMGIKMPVAVVLGGDPVYTYAATAPLPPNVDEYMLAGFLRKRKVELVKCITLTKENYGYDIHVPEDADIVIEGYVDPNDDLIWEGPFGDHTGYYSLADWYPKFHITCITHKKQAVYPSTIVGIPPQEDAWIGKATERIFIAPIKMTMLPEMTDMEMPIEGVFHNLTLASIKKEFSGHGQKVMNAMWGAGQMMFNKILVVHSDDTNIHDYTAVAQSISKHVDPIQDITLSQGPADVLDHSCSKFAFGGKMFLDATRKTEEEINDAYKQIDPATVHISEESILASYPEISGINLSLLDKGISAIFIGVKKNKSGHIRMLHHQLMQEQGFDKVKFFIYVDHTVPVDQIGVCIWHFANNIDPKRDVFLYPHNQAGISQAAIDGTRKTKKWDGFLRPWPNIIVMDEAVIEKVDANWNRWGLGEFIPSPSHNYRSQIWNEGAVVIEES